MKKSVKEKIKKVKANLKAKRKAKKEEQDNYPTPTPLVSALVWETKNIVPREDYHLVEPSCGDGVFIRSMRGEWPGATITGVDIRDTRSTAMSAGASEVWVSDWVKWVKKASFTRPVLAIGNPPFSLAQAHIEAAFDHFPAGSYISFLLRLSFWGGLQRTKTFWDFRGLPYLYSFTPIAPRPSFVRGTSDNSEYGLFVWRVGGNHLGTPEIRPSIVWSKS